MAKLYYYEGKRGEAEAIRMMFSEAGMAFTDVAVTEADIASMTASGDILFGYVPMVDFGDVKLVEQTAILEHICVLADKAGSTRNKFLGRNEGERSVARALASGAKDLRVKVMNVAQKTADKSEFVKDVLPVWFASIDKLAIASMSDDKGLGPGTDFTFGDVAIFEAVNAISTIFKTSSLRPYPNLKEWHDKTIRRSALEKYINQRKDAEW